MSERKKAAIFRKEYATVFPEAHVHYLMDARNTHKKPYDTYILHNGNFFAIEHKEISGATINGSILKTHQCQGLEEVDNARGFGFVMVFVKQTPKVMYLFHIKQFIELFKYDRVEGKGVGIKTSKLEKYALYRKKINNKTAWEWPDEIQRS